MTLQQYRLILSDFKGIHLWPTVLKLKCTLVSFCDFMHYSSALWRVGSGWKMKHIVCVICLEKSTSFVTLLLGPIFPSKHVNH